MKKTAIVHPFFFSIFPILFLFTHNINELAFSDLIIPLSLALILAAFLLFVGKFIFKENTKAGIVASIVIIIFFSFGHILYAVEDYQIAHTSSFLILGMLIIVISCAILIQKSKNKFSKLTKNLNVVSSMIIILSFINIGFYQINHHSIFNKNGRTNFSDNTNSESKDTSCSRDIYYIILDTYARNSTLNDIYGYNNSAITDTLSKKGFFIGNKSRSNYAMTFLSLASSLNMQYINHITNIEGINSIDRKLPYKMIENSNVMNLLKSKKYKFINLNSGWGPTNYNKNAENNVQYIGKWNSFNIALAKTTGLIVFINHFDLFGIDVRERILGTFSKLAEMPTIKGPKFIFAHIVCPHEPFVFGQNGESVQQNVNESISKQKVEFINQIIFLNKKISEVVDTILSKSKVTPIIIFQADHGTCTTFPNTNEWSNPTDINLKERLSIFNACLLPDGGNKLLYDSITPVNSFRLIFNYYFKTHYPLLNDQSYFSTYVQPYKFINVTEKVR